MSHRHPVDKNRAILWSRNILAKPDQFLILDLETTGLLKKDVIIQIGIIDIEGKVIFDSLIHPLNQSISKEAEAIHGINIADLQNAHEFKHMYNHLKELLESKTILIYHAAFDRRLIKQTCKVNKLPNIHFTNDCAMEQYSAFLGEWDERIRAYAIHQLPGADHSALGDCYALLDLIKQMANSEFIDVPKRRKRKWRLFK